MNILAWIILGAIAADTAGAVVQSRGHGHPIRRLALGIASGLVCGMLSSLLLGVKDPIQGALDPGAVTVAVAGATLVGAASALIAERHPGA